MEYIISSELSGYRYDIVVFVRTVDLLIDLSHQSVKHKEVSDHDKDRYCDPRDRDQVKRHVFCTRYQYQYTERKAYDAGDKASG